MCLTPSVATDAIADAAVRDTVFVVPGIVVEAPRIDPRAHLFNRSGFVAMVDLGERRDRVEDLSAVLSQMLGVRVKQYGGMGGFATASIRGSSASQVNVYVDGIPVSDPYLGITNLADLPLGGVERVEVYRGFSPPELGSSAIGGAINLVTTSEAGWRRDQTLSALEAYESAGSFGSRRHQATVWSLLSRMRLYLHGSYATSRGDFTFHDDNGTPENSADDSLTTRTNNDLAAWNIVARAHSTVAGIGQLTLGYDDVTRDQGVPGLGSFQSTTARSNRRRQRGIARFESTSLWQNRMRVWANGFYTTSNEQYTDPNGDIALLPTATDNTIRSLGGSGRAKFYAPALPVSIEGVFEWRKEQFHPVDHLPTLREGPDRNRRSQTIAITGEVFLFDQSLVVSATQRFESHDDEFYDEPALPWLPPNPRGRIETSRRSPSAGARWRATRWMTLKGNVGRYYRLPSFLELFGNTGSVSGNGNLMPEAGVNRDVGVVLSGDRVLFELSYLDNDVDNLILFFPNSQFTSKPQNIGSARISGWEMSVSARARRELTFAASYARLYTKDTSDIPFYNGNKLPSRPRDDISASVTSTWRLLQSTIEYHYIGTNFLDRANLRSVPARNLVNAALKIRTPVTGLAFTVEGRNLTDDRASDVAGFPLPGRAFFTTLGYSY